MLLHEEEETLDQIRLDAPAHPAGAAGQTRLALPPLGVETLDDAGLSRAFLAGVMLLLRKEALVGFQTIGDNGLGAVVGGHVLPAEGKRVPVSLTKGEV